MSAHLTSGDVDPTSRRHAIAAGFGLLIVVLTYGPSRFGDGERYWAAGATILVAFLLADALYTLRTVLPIPGAAPATIVGALIAAGLCVPETDQFPVAALLPLVVVAIELVQRRQAGIEWYVLAAASVGWAAMFGATGRQSALAGALFAWWAVVLVPLVHVVRPIPNASRAAGIAALGAVAAVVMARTGGISDSWPPIVLSVVGCAVVSFGASLAIAGA